jgi:hypothetical protein
VSREAHVEAAGRQRQRQRICHPAARVICRCLYAASRSMTHDALEWKVEICWITRTFALWVRWVALSDDMTPA